MNNAPIFHLGWFHLEWYKFLLEKRAYTGWYKRKILGIKIPWRDNSWLRVILCRIRAHPEGVFWFSSGYEPDMHCRNCGDDLG